MPNDHIGTINDLKPSDIPYLEMSEKKGIDFISSKVENFDKNELVLGYHVPPFNSGWFSFMQDFLEQCTLQWTQWLRPLFEIHPFLTNGGISMQRYENMKFISS